MPLFLIQNMDTGERLPVGGSTAEFSHTKAPRLFHRKVDAINCLECWKEGFWWNDIDSYGDGNGLEPARYKGNNERSIKRKAMNLAIRSVRIEVGDI